MNRRRQRSPNPPEIRENNLRVINTHFINLLPEYRGDNDELSVNEFLNKLNQIGLISNWTDQEKLIIAKLKLKDSAANHLTIDSEINNTNDFQQFSDLLIQRFQKRIPLATTLQNFAQCNQGDSESVQNYAARIRKLAVGILSPEEHSREVLAAHDRMIQARFTSGLKENIQRPVLSKGPRNFSEAVEIAQTEELNDSMVAQSRISNKSDQTNVQGSVINLLVDQITALNLKVEKLSEQAPVEQRVQNYQTDRRNYRNAPERKRCFYCNNYGHFRRNCPLLFRSQTRNSNRSTNQGNARGGFSASTRGLSGRPRRN